MANRKRTTKITKTTRNRRRPAPLVHVRNDPTEGAAAPSPRARRVVTRPVQAPPAMVRAATPRGGSPPRRRSRGRSLARVASSGIQSLAAAGAVKRGLRFGAKRAAIDAVITFLSLGVVLIGLGILMAALVPALAGYVEPLWLRMVIAAVAYVLVGTILASLFARRLRRDALGTTGLARWTAGIFRGRYGET